MSSTPDMPRTSAAAAGASPTAGGDICAAADKMGPDMMTSASEADTGVPMPARIGAVIAVSAGSMMWAFDSNVANIALPTIARDLVLPASASVTLVTVYSLVLAMALLPFAAIGDRLGYRRVYVYGLWLHIIGAIGCQLAVNFPLLIAARIVQALAAALVISVGLGLVRNIWPLSMLGRGMGLNTLASAGGAALAPLLGGLMIDAVTSQSAFAAATPLAAMALLLARFLPAQERSAQDYDKTGALLCAMTFGLLIFGLQMFGAPDSSKLGISLVVAGAAVATLFVWHERRISFPVLPIDLLRDPVLSLSIGGGMFVTLAVTFLMLHLPFELSEMGFSAATVGKMITPFLVASLLAAPASVMLSDKISPNVLGLLGLIIATVTAVAFVRLPESVSYFDIAWRTALSGLGFSVFLATNGRIMVSAAPKTRVAGASSLLGTTRNFGTALGAAVFGLLLAMKWATNAPVYVVVCLSVLGLLCAIGRLLATKAVPTA